MERQGRKSSSLDEEALGSVAGTCDAGRQETQNDDEPLLPSAAVARPNAVQPRNTSSRHTELRPVSSHVTRRRHVRARVKEVAHLLADLKPWQRSSSIVLIAALAVTAGALYLSIENGIVGVVFFPLLKKNSEMLECGVVIDAGSHGTRAHLYSWPPRVHDVNHPISGPITYPSEVASCNTTFGVSSLADGGTAESLLGPLISCLEIALIDKNIPRDHWATFPIFLRATAGMRNLDAETRSQIMNQLRSYLANDTAVPFAFQWNWARVTAGEEEGVYGWLTVNNILRTALLPAMDTFGALDMGGASIQITFSPVHRSVIEGYYGLNFGGQLIRLYSHSFLGYGWGDAIMRLSTKLAVEAVLQFVKTAGTALPSGETTQKKMLNRTLEVALNKSHTENDDGAIFEVESTNAVPLPNPKMPSREGHGVKTANVTAFHPCYPKGHELQFAMPSLVYPDGRFFIDVDVESLRKYMTSIGIPEDYVDSAFQRHRSMSNPAVAKPLSETDIAPFVAPGVALNQAIGQSAGSNQTMQAGLLLAPGGSSGVTSAPLQDLAVDSFLEANSFLADLLSTDIVDDYNTHGYDYVSSEAALRFDTRANAVGKPRGSDGSTSAIPALVSINVPKEEPALGRRLDSDQHEETPARSKKKKSRDKLWKIAHTPVRIPLTSEANKEKSFLPLDAPFPALAGPKLQWIIHFIGTGDFAQCHGRAKELFYNQPCFIHSCSFNGVYQPRLEGSNFIAFGQFSKITHALGLPARTNPRQIQDAARKICKLSKSKLLALRKQQPNLTVYGKKGILNLCWKSIWASTVLHWGWKFPSNTSNILFASTVGTPSAPSVAGWAAGSIFYEVNSLPWKMASGQFETPYFVLVAAVLFFATACVLLLVQMRQYRRILNLVGLVPVPLIEGLAGATAAPPPNTAASSSALPRSAQSAQKTNSAACNNGPSCTSGIAQTRFRINRSLEEPSADYTLLPPS